MALRASGKRVYRNPLDDVPDQVLFFALFIAGTAAIWILKARGLDQVTVTVVPCALMVLYALIALITKRYRLREDKVADNIYYLGFLYTLVSLAYALHVFKPDGSGATDVITNFGIAIFTTILGLAGRVLFNQMREDPIEYEREARYSLAEAINSMRAQLGDIATEASMFKRKLAQILEEGMNETAEATRASLAENVQRFGQTAAEVIGKIDDAFAAFSEHSARLNQIAGQSVIAVEALVTRLHAVDVSPEMISAKFDPVLEGFKEAAAETTKRNRAHGGDMKRIKEAIDASNLAAEGLHKLIEQTDQALGKKLDTVAQRMDRAASAAALLATSFEQADIAWRGEDAAAGGLGAIRKSMEAHRKAMDDIGSSVAEDLSVAREHRDAMQKLLIESRDGLGELEKSLLSLTKVLVEQVSVR
jgi:hypothetical protein